MKLTEKERQAQAYIISEVEKALATLYQHYADHSATSGMVSVEYIKKSHHVFIEGMKKAIQDDVFPIRDDSQNGTNEGG